MHFYESMAHEKYSILKSCCRSNKTHQAAESTLCHHLHLSQARLQMQFPVWYLLSQMVSGKPGGDVLCSPHAVSSWFLFLCVCGGGGTVGNYVSPLPNIFNPRPSWVCLPIFLQNTTTFFQKRQLKFSIKC